MKENIRNEVGSWIFEHIKDINVFIMGQQISIFFKNKSQLKSMKDNSICSFLLFDPFVAILLL